MFERFSDRSRKAMAFANWFANSTGSEHITENYVFAGLVIQNEGVAIEVLRHLDISTDQVRQWYGLTHKKSDFEEATLRLPTTESARGLIDGAIKFCQANRHNGVGTEHLLVGWLSIQNEATDVFFKNTGLSREAVEAKVLELLAGQRYRRLGLIARLLRSFRSN